MNQLFAERLKSARMMNGYSLQDLSDKLENKITRQALHKYEKGEVVPDSEMLGHLCNALNVRPDFFTNEPIELSNINFRKIEKLPNREQSSIIERTKEFLARYLELEEIMGFKKPFSHPLPGIVKIETENDVEDFAIELRKVWNLGIDPISNIVELLEEMNIKVIEIDADDDFDGLQTWVNGKDIPVIVLNRGRLKSDDRKRFTALHELGHLLLPLDGIPEKLAEKYCHRFAAAMLIPKQTLIAELGTKRTNILIQELGLLKQEYGISIQALVIRIKDIGIITDHYLRYYFQYIIRMGWKKEEPFEYVGKEKSNRFDQLIFRALSEEIISINKASSLKNMKLAEFKNKVLAVQ